MRRKSTPIQVYPQSAEDLRLIAIIKAERSRLCDPVAIEAGFKALARIRRKMQLLRAERAVALEKKTAAVAVLESRYAAAKARAQAKPEQLPLPFKEVA